MLLPNIVINIFVSLQLFVFLYYLSIRQEILSIRNALLLNIGKVCLINFVTINLLEKYV